MAEYDGSIRINTKIDSKQASAQLMTLENRIVKTADKISSLRSKMDDLRDVKIPTQEFKVLEVELKKAISEYDNLQAKMEELGKPTEKYKSLQKELQNAQESLEKLARLQDESEKMGLPIHPKSIELLASASDKVDEIKAKIESLKEEGKAFIPKVDVKDIEDAKKKVDELEKKMEELRSSGRDTILGSNTEEYAKLGQQLKYAENDMAVLNRRHDELIAKQGKVFDGYKKLGKSARESFDKINKSAKKTGGFLSTMASRFKGLALSLLIFNQISKAFNAMTSGIKQGFENFYKGNERFRNSVDSLKASLLTLKNSLAAAFAPLVQTVIPYIQKAVEWLTVLINKIGQFIAAVSGQKTYTRAIKQTTAAIKEQNKAQNKQLSSLDKLNNLSSDKDSGADDGGADDGGAADMFEEVPIDKGILDFLQKIKDFLKPIIDYAKKLKDVFMQGFWDGLGDWEYRWESIKDSIKSIKDSLIDIWTDPAVLAAADKWAQSVAYMLGSLVGSLASIGLTIATNLIGGIAKYLEQNKDRIKGYLISMFDIWAEINMMFAELFQSIAYVFEAFASEQGQQLTANIIGIFTDAFMGITELASKLFRDIANIIIQPFVDNKEALRAALEGFLGVLSEVTGTIKDGIDATFDKLNEVYNEHFKPFFDSVAQGLSDLLGQFLEFWNGNVQPILDQWAADFDELWKSHIQPLLDNAAEFLGKIADLLKVVWENYLQPMIAWIIANVLPKVLPVLQAIWDTLKNLIGYIADAISNVITILGGLIDFITGVFSGDWERAFGGLQDAVGGFIDLIKTIIEGGLQFISDILNTFVEAVKGIVDSLWEAIKSLVTAGINFVKQNIIGKFNEIKAAFSTFKSNVSQIWSNMWNGLKEKVSNIIGNIKNIVKNAFDWISQKVKAIGDAFGRFVEWNWGGSGNSTRSNARSSSYSMSTPTPYAAHPAIAKLSNIEIPQLATGAVLPANREFLALVGDQKHGTNIEAPLSTIEEAVINAMAKVNANSENNGGGSVTIEIPVIINGIGEIGRAVQKFDKEFFKQNHRHAFT